MNSFDELCQHVQCLAPHISEDFLLEVVKNFLSSRSSENDTITNITGSPLSDNQINELNECVNYCKAIYTSHNTRVSEETGTKTVKEKINEIKLKKKAIAKSYKSLEEILENSDKILARDPVVTGILSGHATLTVPIDAQANCIKDGYKRWWGETNSCLKHYRLEELPLDTIGDFHKAQAMLKAILDDCDHEYQLYCTKEGNFTETAHIVCSVLSTAGISDLKKITVLNVGFRNRAKDTGILPAILKSPISYLKHNPDVKFQGEKEVNYIAFLEEEDRTLNRPDKLWIVFSGSNGTDDWVKNCTIGYKEFFGLSAHEGTLRIVTDSEFVASYQTTMDNLKRHYLGRQPQNLEIVTTGHSLGGALALLTAYYHVKEKKCPFAGVPVKAVLFGAPPILSKTSKSLVEDLLGKSNIFRVWTFDDPVARLTESFFHKLVQDSVHVGTSYPLYNIHNHPKNFMDDTSILIAPSHWIDTYLSRISDLRSPPEIYQKLLTVLEGSIRNIDLECITSLKPKNSWGRFCLDLVPVVGPVYNLVEHCQEGKYLHATFDGVFVVVDGTTLGWAVFARGSAIKGAYKAMQFTRNIFTPVGREAYKYVGKQGVNIMRRAGVGLLEGGGKVLMQVICTSKK